MILKDKSRRLLFSFPGPLLFLEVLHFLLRWMLLNSPFFSELDYDEGIIGLMALHILRGEPQLMLWGLPRMGGLEAYLASFIFYLFGPSTWALQFSLVLVSSVILFTIYALGKKMGGPKAGIIAAAYWAIPPVFLSFTEDYLTGGHLEAVLAGALVLYSTCTFSSLNTRSKGFILIALVGVLSGIGFWSSLLIMPFLLAAAVGLVGTRPRLLWSPLPWTGIIGYLLGSLPFWSWNLRHDFNTLVHLGGKHFLSAFYQLYTVLLTIIPTFIGIFWDGQGVGSSIPKPMTLVVLMGCYFPVLIISLAVVFQWIRRIGSKQLPFQGPIDYVVLTFWFYILVRASGDPEELGLTRYAMALYVPISLLVSFWIIKIIDFRKALGIGILIGFLGFNLWTNILYLDLNKNTPARPVEELINTFQKLKIRYCYADSRISQVVTFQSREKIIAADYYGWRNYEYLRTVDRAPAREIAILTHRILGNPYPETMEATLLLLGCTYEKKEMGDYVFFYHFKKSGYDLQSIPTGEWKVTASHESGQCVRVKDRDLLTAWRVPKRAGEWLQIDLGRVKKLGRVSFLSGPIESGLPYQFRLEISRDGRFWKTLREVKDYLPGLYWYNDHPRLDKNPSIQLMFLPQEGRYLRITNLSDVENPNDPWTIAEIFIYEAAPGKEKPPIQAVKSLDQARIDLDHWMDDPTGPQPSGLPISMNFRKKQVHWGAVIQLVSQAVRQAPDWEAAHQLFGQALQWGDFWNCPERSKNKPGRNPLDLFPRVDSSWTPIKSWGVISNYNGREARWAIDGDPFTRWTSLKSQEPGMFFQTDLGGDFQVNGFSLFLGSSLNDYPRVLKVLSSLDGENWQEVQASSHSDYAFYRDCLYKKVLYRIDPVRARYLRLMETGADPSYWWSIYDLKVFGKKG
jgi:hypothetical protein